MSYSGKFNFAFSFHLSVQILAGLSAPSHLSAPDNPTPGLLVTVARGLWPLRTQSVHEEFSVSAKCNAFYFLKIILFYFEGRSEHFLQKDLKPEARRHSHAAIAE